MGAEKNGDAGITDAGKMSNVRTASRRRTFNSAGSKDAVAVTNGREDIGGDGSNPAGTPRVLLPLLLFHYNFHKFLERHPITHHIRGLLIQRCDRELSLGTSNRPMSDASTSLLVCALGFRNG